MRDTVKVMLESDFGFATQIISKNQQILDEMDFVSEEVRQLTGFTPEKVVVLNDDKNIYIEFANNLERLMKDADIDLREALDMVTTCNGVSGHDVNLIIDESFVERINMEEAIKVIGKEHILRK